MDVGQSSNFSLAELVEAPNQTKVGGYHMKQRAQKVIFYRIAWQSAAKYIYDLDAVFQK